MPAAIGATSARRTPPRTSGRRVWLRLLSAYGRGDRRSWIITEADRSVTTVLLPEDD